MSEDQRDRMCVMRCLGGDREAFGEIVDRYQKPVYNLIVRLGADREEARDIAQQVFINIYQHLHAYDPARRFFSWLYRAAVNETINHMKGRRSFEPLNDVFHNTAPNPEERLEAAEQEEEIQRGLLAIDIKYRLALIVRHFLQLSYEEAAYVLSVPEKTVKSRLFTARQQLRQALEEQRHARR